MRGFILVDKDKGESSFDVVKKVRLLSGEKKVGHAGTLDPLATGLLLVAIGEGTKLLEFFVGCDKEYEVRAKFGFVSDTFDAEGEIREYGLNKKIDQEGVEALIVEDFVGEIDQVPPKFSALKIGGKKAYEMARKGEEFEMKSRRVKVDGFEVLDYQWPEVSFRIRCGTGTYIRSLVHDLGMKMGCGGYVVELRRTVVGDFDLSDAVKLDGVGNKFEQAVLPLESVVGNFDRLVLSLEDQEELRNGKVMMGKRFDYDWVVMAFSEGELVGVLENAKDGDGIKFRKLIF